MLDASFALKAVLVEPYACIVPYPPTPCNRQDQGHGWDATVSYSAPIATHMLCLEPKLPASRVTRSFVTNSLCYVSG